MPPLDARSSDSCYTLVPENGGAVQDGRTNLAAHSHEPVLLLMVEGLVRPNPAERASILAALACTHW